MDGWRFMTELDGLRGYLQGNSCVPRIARARSICFRDGLTASTSSSEQIAKDRQRLGQRLCPAPHAHQAWLSPLSSSHAGQLSEGGVAPLGARPHWLHIIFLKFPQFIHSLSTAFSQS